MTLSTEQLSPDLLRSLHVSGWALPPTLPLAGSAGSNRSYYRVPGRDLVVAVYPEALADPDLERFVLLSKWALACGLPVPKLYEADMLRGQLLLEDLGASTWLDLKGTAAFDPLAPLMLELLAKWQDAPEVPEPTRARVFGLEDLRWESAYFAEHFLGGFLGWSRAALAELEPWFADLALAVDDHPKALMHRDFQSQNIMVQDGVLRLIDYQGARWGSVWYDLGSVLWDPYVGRDEVQVRVLFEAWCALRGLSPVAGWPLFVQASAQRLMQACGAFGNLGLRQGKSFFMAQLGPGRVQLLRVLRALPGTPGVLLEALGGTDV